ncbi:ubiquinone biosynthesis protein COQ4 homolog, mitochondrial-like [Paramacrobiotus metropolitanus]|uniref:ubiquinone biosynthesis protein COQ4 homolog, mitochondrial-like n=1 Tax=Paramacrobiotus metropolitanus TaxID=2943436 RepID=UPI0024464429|nr:ubiquinone biosynthesis protein COQ4 homolog, mitochondrial-like [Paramacrobiotus metropolitanus]
MAVPLFASHIPTSYFQKTLLTFGAGLGSFLRPSNDELIATFGEVTAYQALVHMRKKMTEHPEGRKILKERPLINSHTVDFAQLKECPRGTFGEAYLNFLETNGVSPDTRKRVHFVDDDELAYVMQRYREIHDLVHTLLGMKTNMLGEITVKWIEALQFGLPMCVLAGIFGPWRLKTKHRQLYLTTYLPWAIDTGWKSQFLLNVYFEQRWHSPLSHLRQELHLPNPPPFAGTNQYDIQLLKAAPDTTFTTDKL